MEKSPFIKKSPEIKSPQFETLFSRPFFLAPIWFHTKTSPGIKSPIIVENAWEQIECLQPCKKGEIDIKNTHDGYIQNTDG